MKITITTTTEVTKEVLEHKQIELYRKNPYWLRPWESQDQYYVRIKTAHILDRLIQMNQEIERTLRGIQSFL